MLFAFLDSGFGRFVIPSMARCGTAKSVRPNALVFPTTTLDGIHATKLVTMTAATSCGVALLKKLWRNTAQCWSGAKRYLRTRPWRRSPLCSTSRRA